MDGRGAAGRENAKSAKNQKGTAGWELTPQSLWAEIYGMALIWNSREKWA